MSDLAAPSLHTRSPAAWSLAEMPTECSAEFPLHARDTPTLCFEEVTQAGFCTGATYQAARKVALTHPASAVGQWAHRGAGAGHAAEVPRRALGGQGKSG